jgi:hypothetical protein
MPCHGAGGRIVTHLIIDGADTKNGTPIEWPIPLESTQLLEGYISMFRPMLPNAGGPYLIPGGDAPMRP